MATENIIQNPFTSFQPQMTVCEEEEWHWLNNYIKHIENIGHLKNHFETVDFIVFYK